MLASRRHGQGPEPLLLLHGFLGAGRNLSSLARLLVDRSPELTVHLPDLPGHGSSAMPEDGEGFEAMAREVMSFIRGLGPAASLAVAGHSFGARVALACLARAPETIAKVAILDMSPGPLRAPAADRMVEDLRDAPGRFENRAVAERYFHERTHDASIVAWLSMNLKPLPGGAVGWRIDRAALARVHATTGPIDLWPVVEREPGRIALLKGARSGLVSTADETRLAGLGVPVTTIPDAGHFLHVDAPEATATFLQGWASSAR